MMTHRPVGVSCIVALLIGACVGDEATPELSESSSTLTETVADGVVVRSQWTSAAGDATTEIFSEDAQGAPVKILAKGWFSAADGGWDYVVIGPRSDTRGEIATTMLPYTPSLANLNALLVGEWRGELGPDDLSTEPLFRYDAPGCTLQDHIDIGHALSFKCSHCFQECCYVHDKCYKSKGCTSASWDTTPPPGPDAGPACQACNQGAKSCFIAGCIEHGLGDECDEDMCDDSDLDKKIDAYVVERQYGLDLTEGRSCPCGEHRCYDSLCPSGSESYCAVDCYTSQSPCETCAAGSEWCMDYFEGDGGSICTDARGRLGRCVPTGTCLSMDDWQSKRACECWDAGTRLCQDDRCFSGKKGYCTSDADHDGTINEKDCSASLETESPCKCPAGKHRCPPDPKCQGAVVRSRYMSDGYCATDCNDPAQSPCNDGSLCAISNANTSCGAHEPGICSVGNPCLPQGACAWHSIHAPDPPGTNCGDDGVAAFCWYCN